jgi:anti-sigma B factor antagonist
MDLEILEREYEGIRILDLRGRLVAGDAESLLRRTIMATQKNGFVYVILNFREVKEIDDDGLATLVLCHAVLRNCGALKLLYLSLAHMELFVLLKLDIVFEVFGEEQAAVNSFFPNRAVQHYDILEFVKKQSEGPAPSHD